jgi:hypothetical protein
MHHLIYGVGYSMVSVSLTHSLTDGRRSAVDTKLFLNVINSTLAIDVGVDPNLRSPSTFDEDHGTFHQMDSSPLLCLTGLRHGYGRGQEPVDIAHLPIWSDEELKEREEARENATAVLKRSTSSAAEKKVAQDIITEKEDVIPVTFSPSYPFKSF